MKNEARDATLSSRYQYAENVSTLRVILPAVVVVSVFAAMGVPLVWLLLARPDDGDRFLEKLINQVPYCLPPQTMSLNRENPEIM